MKIVLEGQEADNYIASLTNQAEMPQKPANSVAVIKAKVAKLEALLATRDETIANLNNQLDTASPTIEEIPEAPIAFHKPTNDKRLMWTDDDLLVLHTAANKRENNNVPDLSKLLNRTEAAIRAKASHIGLYTKHNKLLVSE